MRGRNIKDVKESNKALLYECVRRNGRITLAALMEITNLSRPTVTGLIRELEDENLIIQIGFDNSNVGRAPTLYGINPNIAYAIGVDFDYPFSRISICDLSGSKIVSSHLKYPRNIDTQTAMDMLINQIDNLIAESGIDRKDFLGIGLGMPGSVDIRKKRSIVLERISDWLDYPVGDVLSERFGLPIHMENDVHALTYAERKLWEEKEFTDTLFVSIRSGIGMAVIMDGHVLNGCYGNTGFLGHTIVDIDGPRCSCGKRGCLELYCSEPAMLKMYSEWTGQTIDSVKTLVERANGRDIDAVRVLGYAGYHLGIGLVNAALVFDVTRIVVNAQFDASAILRRAQETLDENINQYRSGGKVKLYDGRLKEPDYGLGACLMAIEQTEIFSAPTL